MHSRAVVWRRPILIAGANHWSSYSLCGSWQSENAPLRIRKGAGQQSPPRPCAPRGRDPWARKKEKTRCALPRDRTQRKQSLRRAPEANTRGKQPRLPRPPAPAAAAAYPPPPPPPPPPPQAPRR
ncbi:hypothetical protein Rsub_00720 [Raphidocelis subcapitata]|uniref:Uncharacterized protein n=1 Tax=Raphidocelis subcapitata TaxID=307507 RepID=A0A2V0NKX6_9CHLO|nr:hypothetical protein Rsub_00720 [Raphidocelis subcapitata]|eukprot:GBF88008.1 hypothetical protein Rsub_00720 [Raphidocelis subcapitata]